MNYQKLKEFDLNSITSQEQADEWKETVITSDMTDMLQYINFLRWQQFTSEDVGMKYVQRIIQFLSYDEIIDFEREHTTIITGASENLVLLAETEDKDEIKNSISIGEQIYSVKAELEDDFEKIFIVSDGEVLYKFGAINVEELTYAYELFEETQSYYDEIVECSVGTKVNIFSDIVGENQIMKTFIKKDLQEMYPDYVITKKTSLGVISPVYSGAFYVIKKEEVISSDGISEDRLQSQISKIKQEMASKLGVTVNDMDDPTPDFKEEPTWTKANFEDDFKFSKQYNFSISTPDEDIYNPLTETLLNLHTDDYQYLNDQYIDEVYQLMEVKFGIAEETEGIWAIPNTKLESVLRTIVRANGKVKANDDNASMFLQRFLREEKLERILKTSKSFQVVKKIRTKSDIEEFVKDAGTEMYHQIGQTITAVLEGTQRIYGNGYIVFDSDRKLTICQGGDEIDLISASNYAIDNDYTEFYIIANDTYTHYDAWYKETLKTKDDSETVINTGTKKEETVENADEIVETETVKSERVDDYHELAEYSEPTDIVVFGAYEGHDIELTDDESSFAISVDGKIIEDYASSDGFLGIMPASEMFNQKRYAHDGWDYGESFEDNLPICDYFLIRNYQGIVKMKVKGENGFLTSDEINDLEDSLIYRNEGVEDLIIDFKAGSNVVKITDDNFNEFETIYLRESKLERIVETEETDDSEYQKTIFKSDTPQDIVIMGTQMSDKSDIYLTDDYTGYTIIKKDGSEIELSKNQFKHILKMS